jgi:hypothetical protein
MANQLVILITAIVSMNRKGKVAIKFDGPATPCPPAPKGSATPIELRIAGYTEKENEHLIDKGCITGKLE